MNIVISSVTDKGSGNVSEDVILIDRDNSIFGVFDGATSLTKYVDPQGKTGGLIAAEIAEQEFRKSHPTLPSAVLKASARIQEEMTAAGIDTSKAVNRWGAAAAAVKLKPDAFEWLVVGDSTILVIMEDGSFREVTPYHDHDTEVLTQWKKFADEKASNIRDLISEELVDLRNQSNVSFGAINGDEAVQQFLYTGEESLSGVKHILLFTDGLLLPGEEPAAPKDFQEMVDLYRAGGLEKIKETVRSMEKADPNCWRYPRYKPHDDIAAIALTF